MCVCTQIEKLPREQVEKELQALGVVPETIQGMTHMYPHDPLSYSPNTRYDTYISPCPTASPVRKPLRHSICMRYCVWMLTTSAKAVCAMRMSRVGPARKRKCGCMSARRMCVCVCTGVLSAMSLRSLDDLEQLLGQDSEAVKELRQLFKIAEGYG